MNLFLTALVASSAFAGAPPTVTATTGLVQLRGLACSAQKFHRDVRATIQWNAGAVQLGPVVRGGTRQVCSFWEPDSPNQLAGSFFDLSEGRITRVTTYYNLADWTKQVS